MIKYGLLGIVVVVVVLVGFSLIDGGSGQITAEARLSAGISNSEGYARAIEPYDWQFPRDFGSHDAFQTEWWYYTGNLSDETGRRFGYQFTIFRRAISPSAENTDSEWRTNQIFMVHFTVSDIETGQFFHEERYGRGSADLAGALPALDPANPSCGVSFNVAVNLTNLGSSAIPAGTTFRVEFQDFWAGNYLEGYTATITLSSPINPGGNFVAVSPSSFNLNNGGGQQHEMRVIIDSNNTVAETNESNNLVIKTFTLGGSC